jgi:glycerol-3-phosphate dehydrogenase
VTDGGRTGGASGRGVDVLVIGGGVCGLWALHALLDAGYDAWLLERSALGDGQTIASQGILHAGAKYRLPGNAVDAARRSGGRAAGVGRGARETRRTPTRRRP